MLGQLSVLLCLREHAIVQEILIVKELTQGASFVQEEEDGLLNKRYATRNKWGWRLPYVFHQCFKRCRGWSLCAAMCKSPIITLLRFLKDAMTANFSVEGMSSDETSNASTACN
ncbi:hypothetical protein ACKKBG_A26135 [Auxenochlorella protothecoides x Auxenochlorella symbiontica]